MAGIMDIVGAVGSGAARGLAGLPDLRYKKALQEEGIRKIRKGREDEDRDAKLAPLVASYMSALANQDEAGADAAFRALQGSGLVDVDRAQAFGQVHGQFKKSIAARNRARLDATNEGIKYRNEALTGAAGKGLSPTFADPTVEGALPQITGYQPVPEEGLPLTDRATIDARRAQKARAERPAAERAPRITPEQVALDALKHRATTYRDPIRGGVRADAPTDSAAVADWQKWVFPQGGAAMPAGTPQPTGAPSIQQITGAQPDTILQGPPKPVPAAPRPVQPQAHPAPAAPRPVQAQVPAPQQAPARPAASLDEFAQMKLEDVKANPQAYAQVILEVAQTNGVGVREVLARVPPEIRAILSPYLQGRR